MPRTDAWISAGAAALLAVSAATATGALARAAPTTAAGWHIIKSVRTDFSGDFTAVVATGAATGWAFDGLGYTAPPTAWERTGGSWRKVAFPGRLTEEVVTAGASAPSDVWAFANDALTGGSRVLHWNGVRWLAVRSFPGEIAGASVLARDDVWVFGELPAPFAAAAIGVWHYDGHSWSRVGRNLSGGSALSATDVWGFTRTRVLHWNGRRWTSTPVRRLLPRVLPDGRNDPMLVGILALSDASVYAVANGNDADGGGPLVVLHYDGRRWSRVAEGDFGDGPGPQFSSDGTGGLWLPMTGVDGAPSYLLHFTAGKLIKTTLPDNPATISIGAVARIPGSARQLAGGFTHASGNLAGDVVAVLLQYG